MTEIRRFIAGPELDPQVLGMATVVNRIVDRDNGVAPGRIWLLGDDGDQQEIIGGDVLSSNNYPLRVQSDIGNHGQFTKSDGLSDVLRIQDAGLTIVGTVGITGAVTITGAITASGAATLNGAVTLGDNVADVITITGTATFAENVTMVKGLVVDTTTLVVDAVNNRVGVLVTPTATTAAVEVAGVLRATNTTGTPTAGSGLELFFNTGSSAGTIQAYDRTGAAGLPLVLFGLSTTFYAGAGVEKIKVDATGIGVFGHSTAAQQSVAAAATDPASTQTLANSLRALVRAYGWAS